MKYTSQFKHGFVSDFILFFTNHAGKPEKRSQMASHLKDLVLSNNMKLLMADKVGPTLVQMLSEGDSVAQESSLSALCQISSNEESAAILIEARILSPILNHLFAVGPNHLASHRMKMKELAATCLSNLVSSGVDFTSVSIDDTYNTLVSENTVEDLLHLVSNTGPAIQFKLLQALTGLTGFESTVKPIITAIKISGALTALVQLIETPRMEIRVASLKLLQNISPYMDQELADILCQSSGQLDSLVQEISDSTGFLTEENVARIRLLCGLSQSNSNIITQLAELGAFEIFASHVALIRQGEISCSRYAAPALEGLVKILSRITFVLQENPKNIQLAISLNLACLFTDLLGINGNDGVLIDSATALGNLSTESKNLSKPPQQPTPRLVRIRFSRRQPNVVTKVCQVHRGLCSAKDTFCLIECKAVEKLVSCLNHNNRNVTEAALGALCTLLEDGVDSNEGVWKLFEEGGVDIIFDVLIQEENKALQRKAVWAVERILRIEDMAKQAAVGYSSVGIALGQAFQLGDSDTREVARKALEHIKRQPSFSDIYTR